jgi:uncharacterized membrane protein HdeD (DUF308 family)
MQTKRKTPETTPMQMCPMAETCKGMMEKRGSSSWMIIPGVVFITLGLAVIIFPQILVLLVAMALIGMGIAMLMMISFMRRIGRRLQNRPR